MKINLVGAVVRNAPFATELAFKRGFDRLGTHEIRYIDPDYPNQPWAYDADATIVFKWLEGDDNLRNLDLCKGKKIVYQPDDLRFPHIKIMMQEMRKRCEFAFTFDDDGARLAKDYGYVKAERLLLTADDELYRPLDLQKDIDVCFVGSLTGGENHRSRVRMCQIVNNIPGVKTFFATDVYNIEDIVKIYNRSKIVLNHATDVGQEFGHGFGYQCRHFEAGFTGAHLLSNLVDNEFEICNFDTFCDELSLVERVKFGLENVDFSLTRGQMLREELMENHRPEHRAKQMVKFIEGL